MSLRKIIFSKNLEMKLQRRKQTNDEITELFGKDLKKKKKSLKAVHFSGKYSFKYHIFVLHYLIL